MSMFDRWTRKAAKKAREAIKETSQEGMKERMDILEGVVKIGVLGITAIAMLKGVGSARHHAGMISPDIQSVPSVSVTNLYFGKE